MKIQVQFNTPLRGKSKSFDLIPSSDNLNNGTATNSYPNINSNINSLDRNEQIIDDTYQTAYFLDRLPLPLNVNSRLVIVLLLLPQQQQQQINLNTILLHLRIQLNLQIII